MEKILYIIFISLFSLNVISCGEKDESSSTPPTFCEVHSAEESCISSSTTLSAPSHLTATSGAGQVILDWTGLSGASSYSVYWDNVPDVSSSSTAITSVRKDYYMHSELDNGTTYFYKVAGENSAGTGPLSIEVSASTPLPAPDNLSAITGFNQIALDWDNVTGAASYTLFWDNSSGITSSDTAITLISSDNYTHTSLDNNTTFYYKIAAVNSSGTGTLSSEVNATYKGSGSLSFDGTNDYVEIAHDNSLNLTDNFTIEAWVNLDSNTNNTILDKGDYNNLFQAHTSGNTGLSYYDRTNDWTHSSGTIPINEWVHVAMSFQTGSNNLKFYKNGQLMSSHTVNNNSPTDAGVMNIGRQSPSTCVCNILDGNIDEVRIWSDIRAQSEIQSYMSMPLTGSESSLVGYWNFNEGRNTTLTGQTSNNNDGTVYGAAWSDDSP